MSFSAVLDSLSSFVTTYSSIHSSFPLPLHLHASPLKKEAGVGGGGGGGGRARLSGIDSQSEISVSQKSFKKDA